MRERCHRAHAALFLAAIHKVVSAPAAKLSVHNNGDACANCAGARVSRQRRRRTTIMFYRLVELSDELGLDAAGGCGGASVGLSIYYT